MTRRTPAEMAAIEAAIEESAARADADAREAEEAVRHSERLARRIRAMNEANHFVRWIFKDAAGGTS